MGMLDSEQVKHFVDLIESRLLTLYEDGSIHLHQEYFSYTTGLRMSPDAKWEALFGVPKREAEKAIEQHHCNLALAVQQVTEKSYCKWPGKPNV